MSMRLFAMARWCASFAAILLSMAACRATPKTSQTPPLAPRSVRAGLNQPPETSAMRLPQNYDSDNSFRRLVIFTNFAAASEISSDSGLPPIPQGILDEIALYCQTQLGKINRFEVYAYRGDQGYHRMLDSADLGLVEPVPSSRLPAPDLYLNGNITLNEDTFASASGVDPYEFSQTISISLQDLQRRQLWSRNFSMKQVEDVVRNVDGSFAGGFKPDNPANRKSVYFGLSRKVLAQVVNQLGVEFPTSGRITAQLGDRFNLNKGTNDGVNRNTTFVTWTKMQGIALPLAYASCEPTRDSSTLSVYRWNTGDPDAVRVIERLRNEPGFFESHELYATSEGLGVPEQWDLSD